MVRSVRCALAMALALVLSACVSDANKGNQGGSAGGQDAGAGSGADSGSSTGPDAMGPVMSCRDVRVCIHNCGQDMTCAGKCVSSAPPAVRQQYEQIQACSMTACSQQDEPCRCDEECIAGGQCFDLVEDCDEAISDPWCDMRCH